MHQRRIEEAALNSWPALQQHLFDGWLLRFAQGYTKRANSVTPLYPSLLPLDEKIACCEHLYKQHQLPPTFRLLSFSQESHHLDHLLAQRGYSTLDHTHVYSLTLPSQAAPISPTLKALSLDEWLPLYAQWTDRLRDLQHLHRKLLEQISSPTLYAALTHHDTYVACGLGVLDHELLGLFDIVTDPQQRRQGFGTQLVTNMLACGQHHGAHHAHLQVLATNQPAQHLYTKLGFQENYQYWYRRQTP